MTPSIISSGVCISSRILRHNRHTATVMTAENKLLGGGLDRREPVSHTDHAMAMKNLNQLFDAAGESHSDAAQ